MEIKYIEEPYENIQDLLGFYGGGIGKGGVATLFVDDKQVAQGRIEATVPVRFSLDESFDVGQDTGTQVIDDYEPKMPFKFTGKLNELCIHLGDDQLDGQGKDELQQAKTKVNSAAQ